MNSHLKKAIQMFKKISNLKFFQGHIDMVHFLLEHGANLNLTARCGAPVASSTSTVLAVARSSSTNTNKEFQDGNLRKS